VTTGIGEALLEAREQQGRALDELARSMRLRTEQLRALEEERFASFGGDIYARGFLRSYALELGLDPQPLLDTYRREVSGDDLTGARLIAPGAGGPGPTGRSAAPSWAGWVMAAVVILAGLGLIGQFAGSRAPPTASPEEAAAPPAPAESGEDDPEAGPDVTEGEDGDGDAPDDAPEEGADPDPAGVDVLLALEEETWMRVTVDGAVVYEQVAAQGETLPFSGEDEVLVRFGNAGGVRVEFNGEDLGVPGARGSVLEVAYTPEFDPEDA
jgi:cytoskeleton protein RodZ